MSTQARSDPPSSMASEFNIGGDDTNSMESSVLIGLKAAISRDQNQADQSRESAAQALAKAQNISIEKARAKVGQYQQRYQQTVDQAKQKAIKAAEMAATVVSRGYAVLFVALLLGALVAWFGGRSGEVDLSWRVARVHLRNSNSDAVFFTWATRPGLDEEIRWWDRLMKSRKP